MSDRCRLILIKDRTGYDISDAAQKIVWSGRKNSPARSLQVTLVDDPSQGEENRALPDVEQGQHIFFYEGDEELFRGIVMTQSRAQDRNLVLTAYDNAIYLSNNNGSFSYRNKTVTDIFMDVCNRFEISRGKTVQTTYKIPNLSNANTSIFDILTNALSRTYKALGERFYILSKEGQLHLLRRKELISKLVLETGEEGSPYGNLTAYSYQKSITDVKTRLRLIGDNGATKVQWFDLALEEKIGMMAGVEDAEEGLNKQKLTEQVVMMLEEMKEPKQSLRVTAFGISSIFSGVAVFISIPEIGISRIFYVDADTHTWDGDYHTMQLTLNFAKDIEEINEEGKKETANNSSALERARALIKDSATALKQKKAAEKVVVTAGNKAEKAADAAEKALAAVNKAYTAYTTAMAKGKQDQAKKQLENAKKQANNAVTQSNTASARYEEAKTAYAEAKALLYSAQAEITTKAQFAIAQAEASARRAAEAKWAANELLSHFTNAEMFNPQEPTSAA